MSTPFGRYFRQYSDKAPYEINTTDLRVLGHHVSYDEAGHNGMPVTKRFVRRWLEDDTKKTFDKFIFEPRITTDPRFFNIFAGFVGSKLPLLAAGELAVTLAPYHLMINDLMAPDDAPLAKYLVQWTAHLLQKPMEPTKIGLCFCNGDSDWQRMYWGFVAESVIGRQHASTTGLPKQDLLSRSANSHYHKVLVSVHAKYHKKLDKVFMDPTYIYQPKGYGDRGIETPNYVNMAIVMVQPPSTEMRHNKNLVIFNGARTPNHNEVMDHMLQACLDSPEFAAAFYQYHMSYDLEGFDPRQAAAELRRAI